MFITISYRVMSEPESYENVLCSFQMLAEITHGVQEMVIDGQWLSNLSRMGAVAGESGAATMKRTKDVFRSTKFRHGLKQIARRPASTKIMCARSSGKTRPRPAR